jgi:hypothetical protein
VEYDGWGDPKAFCAAVIQRLRPLGLQNDFSKIWPFLKVF